MAPLRRGSLDQRDFRLDVHVRDGVAPLRLVMRVMKRSRFKCPRQRWRGSIETTRYNIVQIVGNMSTSEMAWLH